MKKLKVLGISLVLLVNTFPLHVYAFGNSESDLLYQYLEDEIIPEYGLANLEEQQGTVATMEDKWLNPEGIVSAYVSDIDGDNEDEMAVFYYQEDQDYEEEWADLRSMSREEYLSHYGPSYVLMIDIYECSDGQVSCSASDYLYTYYESCDCNNTMLDNSQMGVMDCYVYAIESDGKTDFVVSCATSRVAFGNGTIDNVWAVSYDNENNMLLTDYGFLQTANASDAFRYYKIEDGQSYSIYDSYTAESDDTFIDELNSVLQPHGVSAEMDGNYDFRIVESPYLTPVFNLVINGEFRSGDMGNGSVTYFTYQPTDDMNIRKHIEDDIEAAETIEEETVYETYTVKAENGYLALRTEMEYDSSNEIGKLFTGDEVEVREKTNSDYWYVYSSKLGLSGYVNCQCLYEK